MAWEEIFRNFTNLKKDRNFVIEEIEFLPFDLWKERKR